MTAALIRPTAGLLSVGIAETWPDRGTLLVVLDEWSLADCERVSDHARSTDAVLLPVRLDGSTVLVGPIQHRTSPVCLTCAERGRRTAAMGLAADDVHNRAGLLPPLAVDAIDDVVAQALYSPAGDDTVWAIRGSDLSVTRHRSHAVPGECDRCGRLPVDAAELVAEPRRSGIACDDSTLRSDNLRTSRWGLRAELDDWRHGPVVLTSRSERLSLPIANARVASRRMDGDGGYGRATTFAAAERTALFEAVERITGLAPTARRTELVASYAELGPSMALDPATLGSYEPAAEQHPLFELTPYSPDVRCTWVWGWSQRLDAPVAVPERAAYWGAPPTVGAKSFLVESSNGCGLGNSPEEAALFALFEVIERDAFLMAWYARTPLRRVAVPPEDGFVGSLGDRLDSLGYELFLFDATNDLGVPVIVSLALCRDRDSLAPQAFLAAGAHLDPRRAITAAVVEVMVNVEQAPNVVRATPEHFDRDRLRPMLEDPSLVRGIEDHVGLNALPEARGRLEFLLGGAAPAPWTELWPGQPAPEPDVAALLHRVRATALAAGVDTIVIDQSEPRTRDSLGLHAARVVAPGAIALSFGHLYRRTRGLSRLTEVPARLGRAPLVAYDDLALDPHPFP